jgi:hypothetical protein
LAPSQGGSQWLFFAADLVSEAPVNGSCTVAGSQQLGEGLAACFIADTSSGQGSFSCDCSPPPDVFVLGISGPNSVTVEVGQMTNVESAYLGSGTSQLTNGLYQVNGTWQCVVSCVGLSGSFTLTQSSDK